MPFIIILVRLILTGLYWSYLVNRTDPKEFFFQWLYNERSLQFFYENFHADVGFCVGFAGVKKVVVFTINIAAWLARKINFEFADLNNNEKVE